jgi:zeaxanthin glucosyltransferase
MASAPSAQIGLICFSGTGHVNPMVALGNALQQRGHSVSFIGMLDYEKNVTAAGLGFIAIGTAQQPLGTLRRLDLEGAEKSGQEALSFAISRQETASAIELQELPDILRHNHIDLLLVDSVNWTAVAAAQYVGTKVMTVDLLPPIMDEDSAPAFCFPWKYEDSDEARARNAHGNEMFFSQWKGKVDMINAQRVQWGMQPVQQLSHFWSQRSRISHMPAALDFPRRHWPANFTHTGPFLRTTQQRAQCPFPWEKLNGRPLVYASMGTLTNSISHTFHVIAEAFSTLDVQLVLSTGGGLAAEKLAGLKGSTAIVVDFAPQLELIERSVLVVSHGGINSCLEAVMKGKPSIIIPVSMDQPGNARRMERVGVAEVVLLEELSAERLRAAAEKVLADPSYTERAALLGKTIQASQGMQKAVELVEKELSN